MTREIDSRAIAAANDPEAIEKFIKDNDFFILKVAFKTCRRFVSRNDDEYSIALLAFYDAIKSYDYDSGAFLPFAQLLITRNLIDHFRQQQKYKVEVSDEWLKDKSDYDETTVNLRAEIMVITDVLKGYGFKFSDLVDCSPKADKTKKACAVVIRQMICDDSLLKDMRTSKKLPITKLKNDTGTPQKILERYRKYLIAAAEILSGDFPYLSTYLEQIKRGN